MWSARFLDGVRSVTVTVSGGSSSDETSGTYVYAATGS